jgi:peptide/nickel transport system substrate-binding protein
MARTNGEGGCEVAVLVRRLLIWTVVLALVIGAWPLGAQAQARNRVVVLLGQEPAELFPGFVSNLAVETDVETPMWCGLIGRDDNWKLFTDMALKLPTLKDGDWQLLPNKKMKVTFKIKNTYRWHDGRPVTAEDFVWTLRMRKNPNTPVVSRFVDNKIDNVVSTSPYEFSFQYNEVYAYANLDPFTLLPAHKLRPAYNRNPAQIDKDPFGRAPVACGPYKLKSWSPGNFIELEAFGQYGGKDKAKIPNITFRFILDSTVMTANLIAGEGDATATSNLSLEQLAEIERRSGAQWNTHYKEGLVWEHIDFNMDNEWLKDKRVRQAIAHAVDREAIVQNLFAGRQPVAHTFFGPKHFAFNANVKKYAFDQTRARQLLAEAGFTAGAGGVLRDAQGRPFRMTIMTTSGNAVREQVEQIIKDQLKQVGIDLVIDNRPASVLFGQVTTQRTYPHMVMYAWVSSPITHFRTIWHSKEIPTAANNFVGQNTPGYKNADVDRLLEQADQELDEGKRAEILKRVQELWAEDLPSLPLYFRLELNVSRKSLKNYKPRGIGAPTWNAEQWAY